MTALLGQLWTTSLLLMAAALAWMSWLILSRLFRERSQANRAERRKSVSRAYLQIMGGDAEGKPVCATISTRRDCLQSPCWR